MQHILAAVRTSPPPSVLSRLSVLCRVAAWRRHAYASRTASVGKAAAVYVGYSDALFALVSSVLLLVL